MKYHLMQSVVIVSDTLNVGLPLGALAYVIIIESRASIGTPYFIRVPSEQKEYWSPECDLEASDSWFAKASENVIRKALIDHALATGNKVLFASQYDKGAKPE